MPTDLPTTDQGLSLVDQFLAKVSKKPTARGNLIFALDATGSREPTWDMATHLQAQMFHEAAAIGALDVKLIYFRGTSRVASECKASGWTANPMQLANFMTSIKCRAGITQIGRVFEQAIREAGQRKIGSLIFIGDACEEPRNALVLQARYLAELGVPIFVFQEGSDPQAEAIFREFVEITHGAFHRFDSGLGKLGELLRAVAAFAVGDIAPLEKQGSAAAKLLLGQIR